MVRPALTPYVVQHVPSGEVVPAPAKTAAEALALGISRLRRELAGRQPAPTRANCVVALHGWEVPVATRPG